MAGWLEEGRLGRPFYMPPLNHADLRTLLRDAGLTRLLVAFVLPGHYPQ